MLQHLIRRGVFNTIFTTNFDDLLSEACYTFSREVRPIVCAHDSSIHTIRVASKRPKIIKLHGDFLYDEIKNLSNELETLESNMRDKFRQYASEHGIIFVGYGGNDRSIMDILNILLQNKNNFPHGVYWCILKGTTPNETVASLTRFQKSYLNSREASWYLMDSSGFKRFSVGFALQPEIADPYGALRDSLNRLLESTGAESETNPIIKRDIARIGKMIVLFTR